METVKAFRTDKQKPERRFIDFLKKAVRHHQVISITDQAPAHTADAVDEFAKLNKKKLCNLLLTIILFRA